MWETELKVASAALQLQAQEARRLEHLLIQVAGEKKLPFVFFFGGHVSSHVLE
jgi:hypothetical protein